MSDSTDEIAAAWSDDPTPTTSEPEVKAEGEAEKPAVEPEPTEDGTVEAEAKAEQPKEEDKEPEKEPEPDPKDIARKGFAERQRMKSQATQALRQAVQPPTAEQLEQQGYEKRDAEFEALRQEVQATQFINTVAETTANMNLDAQSIEQEFGIFKEGHPDFDKDFADKVSREYLRDADVQFDPSGQYVLSARVPMYDYFKSRYEDRMAGMTHGKVAGQKAAEQMLASSEMPSSAAPPPKEEEDVIMKIWKS